jgi:hypothetical protein
MYKFLLLSPLVCSETSNGKARAGKIHSHRDTPSCERFFFSRENERAMEKMMEIHTHKLCFIVWLKHNGTSSASNNLAV